MYSKERHFLISALTEHNPFMKTGDFMDWFSSRRQAHRFRVEQIAFEHLEKWAFEPSTGNLRHESGRFFSIEGIWVRTNAGPIPEWSQPVINQPEIGILGILTKTFDGILYFLMQVKMEPGNINLVQLAPTMQATRSNYTLVHHGDPPPYLQYFLDKRDCRVLLDTLQSEQGARFLHKRNRNIIIETTRDVPVLEDFCWLTLGQIHQLIQQDNMVNMDARSVLSCIPFSAADQECTDSSDLITAIEGLDTIDIDRIQTDFSAFGVDVLNSVLDTRRSLHSTDDIISWFTEMKVRYELDVERIPLKFVKNWHQTDYEIVHDEKKYFSVIAVAVQADSREVAGWTQPLVKPVEKGIVGYIVKRINGILHFLVQAKVEPGNFDIIEMAPTVQCVTGSYKEDKAEDLPVFLNDLLDAKPEQIRSSTFQSEEGGRFFQEENRNLLVEAGDDFPEAVPDNFIWMTMNQIKTFVKYNNFVNVQGRCLLSAVGFSPILHRSGFKTPSNTQ